MKASVVSLLAIAAAVNAGKIVSVVYETEHYTITSCAPTVTVCPVGHATSTIHSYTTECDEDDTAYPTPTPEHSSKYDTETPSVTKSHEAYTTSTVYETKEYTVTSCAPTVTNCPVGHVTTTVIASTTVCPVTEKPYPPPAETHPYPPPAETTSTGQETTKPYSPPAETHPYPPPAETTSTGQETTTPYSPPAETHPAPPTAPVYSTVTISTCVPTVITSVITVESPKPTVPAPSPVCPGGEHCPDVTTVKGPYGTAAPSVGLPYPPMNSTVPFTGGANAQRAGGLLFAVGIVAALL